MNIIIENTQHFGQGGDGGYEHPLITTIAIFWQIQKKLTFWKPLASIMPSKSLKVAIT